eukprot:g56337.t1
MQIKTVNKETVMKTVRKHYDRMKLYGLGEKPTVSSNYYNPNIDEDLSSLSFQDLLILYGIKSANATSNQASVKVQNTIPCVDTTKLTN